MGVAQVDQTKDQHHHHENVAGGRSQAKVEYSEREAVRPGVERLAHVGRPATRDGHDHVKNLQRVDEAEQEDHRRHRTEQGPGDVAEALPGTGAVNGGSLVQRARYVLQPAVEDDHVERDANPDVRDRALR